MDDQYHWIWRVILPKGSKYLVRVGFDKIPDISPGPINGKLVFELGAGETILHAIATQKSRMWNLRLSAGSQQSSDFEFEGDFLKSNGVTYEIPHLTSGLDSPQSVILFKGYNLTNSNNAKSDSRSGLLIWMVRDEEPGRMNIKR